MTDFFRRDGQRKPRWTSRSPGESGGSLQEGFPEGGVAG